VVYDTLGTDEVEDLLVCGSEHLNDVPVSAAESECIDDRSFDLEVRLGFGDGGCKVEAVHCAV
jgi:hypothetical protein